MPEFGRLPILEIAGGRRGTRLSPFRARFPGGSTAEIVKEETERAPRELRGPVLFIKHHSAAIIHRYEASKPN